MEKKFVRASIAILIVLLLLSGCKSTIVEQEFEEYRLFRGLSLKRPSNWRAEYYERNGEIYLNAEKGIWNKESITIVIQPLTFTSSSSGAISPVEELEANIERLATHFYGDSMAITQKPIHLEHEKYDFATAQISIPPHTVTEDSPKNEEVVLDQDNFRTVDMRAISCNENFALIYIYRSNNNQLNAEADSIVDSIQLGCLAKQEVYP